MTAPNSSEKIIKGNRVFFLGAGFSAAAGVPLTVSLLEKTMGKLAAECPGIFSRVNWYMRMSTGHFYGDVDYTKEGFFSDFCTFLEYIELRQCGGGERWADTGSREKLALRFYLAKTIAEHTPDAANLPDLYVEFAAQLHEGDVVISFNWDGLLEVALEKIGKPYTYTFKENYSIKLCKLHGSINWRLGMPNNLGEPVNTLSWKSMEFTKGIMEEEIYFTPALLNFSAWGRYPPLGEVEPFLVLPGFGKAFDVRSNAELWYFWQKPSTQTTHHTLTLLNSTKKNRLTIVTTAHMHKTWKDGAIRKLTKSSMVIQKLIGTSTKLQITYQLCNRIKLWHSIQNSF